MFNPEIELDVDSRAYLFSIRSAQTSEPGMTAPEYLRLRL
jgi:hypothetical protein